MFDVCSWKEASLSLAISTCSTARPDSFRAGGTQGGCDVEVAQPGAQPAQRSSPEHSSTQRVPVPEMCAFPGSSNRLFDREPDNRHAEPLLLAQLSAAQIRTLCLRGPLSTCLLQQLADWLSRIAQVTLPTCKKARNRLYAACCMLYVCPKLCPISFACQAICIAN